MSGLRSETSFKLGSTSRAEWCGSLVLESFCASILVSQFLMKNSEKARDPTNARTPQEVSFIERSSSVHVMQKIGPAFGHGTIEGSFVHHKQESCNVVRRFR